MSGRLHHHAAIDAQVLVQREQLLLRRVGRRVAAVCGERELRLRAEDVEVHVAGAARQLELRACRGWGGRRASVRSFYNALYGRRSRANCERGPGGVSRPRRSDRDRFRCPRPARHRRRGARLGAAAERPESAHRRPRAYRPQPAAAGFGARSGGEEEVRPRRDQGAHDGAAGRRPRHPGRAQRLQPRRRLVHRRQAPGRDRRDRRRRRARRRPLARHRLPHLVFERHADHRQVARGDRRRQPACRHRGRDGSARGPRSRRRMRGMLRADRESKSTS